MAKRKICVFTGSRADYGLLSWVMGELTGRQDADLQTIVTGTHLSPEFGLTVREIERDGFPVLARAEILLSADTPTAIASSMGLATIKLGEILSLLRPDIVIVLGDRFESLAMAQAALVHRIPVGHVHGGELTYGAIDDAIRHAITKMAHLHFAAADVYARRIVQMGEDPKSVFNVGALGVDAAVKLPGMSRSEMEAAIGRPIRDRLLLVTYHPATLGVAPPEASVRELLAALDAFPDRQVVLTYANADTDGRRINAMIESYAQTHSARVVAVPSLGQKLYLSLLRGAEAVVGNSSSGIIEAPACGVPTVNIGTRQDGRLRAPSVIDCAEDRASIGSAIAKTVSDEAKMVAAKRQTPYGQGDAAKRIAEIVATHNLDGITVKTFHDL